jgi:hypothetical protein
MTEKQIAVEIDGLTGITVERELTQDELQEIISINAKQNELKAESISKAEARISALAKLAALGLTEEEIAAL